MEFYIKYPGKDEVTLSSLMPNVHLLDMITDSPEIDATYLDMAGSDGERLENVRFKANTVTANLLIVADDVKHFKLVKSQLFSVFYLRELIRIRSSDEPGKAAYVLPQPVDVTPFDMQSSGVVALKFTNPMGYRVSPFLSDEISLHQDMLQFGMGLNPDVLPGYRFEQAEFDILNPSHLTIDPYFQHHNLKIYVKGVGSNFEILNETNNTSIYIGHPLYDKDTFLLDGIRPTINGDTNISSNFGHIELSKGVNHFKIKGLANPICRVSFPFLYF